MHCSRSSSPGMPRTCAPNASTSTTRPCVSQAMSASQLRVCVGEGLIWFSNCLHINDQSVDSCQAVVFTEGFDFVRQTPPHPQPGPASMAHITKSDHLSDDCVSRGVEVVPSLPPHPQPCPASHTQQTAPIFHVSAFVCVGLTCCPEYLQTQVVNSSHFHISLGVTDQHLTHSTLHPAPAHTHARRQQ